MAASKGIPVTDVRLLDTGCGTGSYLSALQQTLGCQVHGLEFNSGMLAQSQSQLGDRAVSLQQGSALAIPFGDNSFDVVLITQVIHHLETPESATGGAANTLGAFREMARVLKPGGVWMCNHSTPEQMREGYWWAELIREEMEAVILPRYLPMDKVNALLDAAGLVLPDAAVSEPEHLVADSLVPKEIYLDIDGPLRADWRAQDSAFASVEQNASVLDARVAKIKEGDVDAFFAKKEAARERVGQSLTIVRTKK